MWCVFLMPAVGGCWLVILPLLVLWISQCRSLLKCRATARLSPLPGGSGAGGGCGPRGGPSGGKVYGCVCGEVCQALPLKSGTGGGGTLAGSVLLT